MKEGRNSQGKFPANPRGLPGYETDGLKNLRDAHDKDLSPEQLMRLGKLANAAVNIYKQTKKELSDFGVRADMMRPLYSDISYIDSKKKVKRKDHPRHDNPRAIELRNRLILLEESGLVMAPHMSNMAFPPSESVRVVSHAGEQSDVPSQRSMLQRVQAWFRGKYLVTVAHRADYYNPGFHPNPDFLAPIPRDPYSHSGMPLRKFSREHELTENPDKLSREAVIRNAQADLTREIEVKAGATFEEVFGPLKPATFPRPIR